MELELKFALPLAEPQLLEKQLAGVPLIGRRKPQRQALHSTYYDTPEHALQHRRVALRVRQIGDAGRPRWVQTLKMGGTADSAFSRRGEWEEPLQTGQPSLALLAGTPWQALDPTGTLYAALSPVFTTRFERLSWTVQLGEASVEIALDRGSVLMDGQSTPLCELEIELLEGAPEALFEAASQISQRLCLLPLHMSKAERAYRLAQGTLHAPLRARPVALTEDMAFGAVAHNVLRESFLQFTANLCTLNASEAPEVLHQARVGWRRFRSALRLFKQRPDNSGLPDLAPLQTLLVRMAALRDLDVAASEVLPTYAAAYQAGDSLRGVQWQQLEAALAQDRLAQRAALRQLLAEPAVGRCLLQLTRWLELESVALPQALQHKPHPHKPLSAGKWLGKRIEKLADALRTAQGLSDHDAPTQHRLRILSKRLRYGVENLRPLLPQKRAGRWLRKATETQTRIGLERDLQQTTELAARLGAAEGIIGFLRGAAFAVDSR
jgi:inorganic triphosphatase YgiF